MHIDDHQQRKFQDEIDFENRHIDALPRAEFGIDFQTFLWLADRWAALGARERAAALAMGRGSMDTAEDLIGLRSGQTRRNPVWDEVSEMVFDIQWHCENDEDDDE
jgi:hypothetical protein